jgi:hypothetical protein
MDLRIKRLENHEQPQSNLRFDVEVISDGLGSGRNKFFLDHDGGFKIIKKTTEISYKR